MLKSISLCTFTLILLLCMTSGDDINDNLNPYRELGVARNANEKQIKNAYRKMAKLWHPDRNKDPGAEAKFMRISRSYEILSDAERRQMYDDYGSTQEPRHGHQQHQHRDNFDNFFRDFHGGFGGGGFRFNQGNQRRKSTAEEINKKIFDETILPNSHTKPFLIFSYTEFCYSCMHVDKEWEELKKEIKNIGFGAGHSDASWNRELSKALGISTVPSIAGIINGRIYHFRGEYTLKNLREFVRGLIPSSLVTELTVQNFNKTLHDTVEENKVMAVFASFSNQPTLRYQMPCFVLSMNVKCTFIRLNSIDTEFHEFLATKYLMQLARSKEDKEEALFLFKENLHGSVSSSNGAIYKPAFNIRARELTYPNILQTFEQNKFLHLPRVSSTQHFYDLCTSWSNQNNLDEIDPTQVEKVLCVLIAADSSQASPSFLFNPPQKAKFLKKIIADDYFKKSARFISINYDIQTEFFEKLAKSLKIKSTEQKGDIAESFFKNKLIVLKRLDDKYAQFEVFDFEDTESDSLMKQQLDALRSVLKGTKHLEYKLIIPDFYDESSHSLFVMVMEYLEEAWHSITDRYFWERLFGNSSYMMVIFCTVLFIWLMTMFSADQSDPLSASRNKKTKPSASKGSKRGSNFNLYSSPDAASPENQSHYYRDESVNNQSNSFDTTAESESHYFRMSKRRCHFELSEMTEENYDYFVKQLPNGLRTILLIVTEQNREQLIEKFVQVAYQFSNKSYHLRFAYLNVSKQSSQRWINEIMFQKFRSLGEENDIDISEDEYDDAIKATLNKLDYENSLITMAINRQRRHFLLHELDISHLYTTCDAEMCYGLEDINRFENKYQIELANWLDKLTEGLSMSDKFTVKNWPEFM